MDNKDSWLTFRLSAELRKALTEIAAKQDRPLSNLIRIIATEYVKTHGNA